MFFIGVFGIENRDKEIKRIDSISCSKCNFTRCRLIKNYDFFHFFFIPIFKWNEQYFVECESCKALYSIKKEKGKAIELGENLDITYWDLQEMNREFHNGSYYQSNVCKRCGSKVDSSFKYCPHCGEEI